MARYTREAGREGGTEVLVCRQCDSRHDRRAVPYDWFGYAVCPRCSHAHRP